MEISILEFNGILTVLSIVFSLIWQRYQKRIILSGYTNKQEENMWHKRGVEVKVASSAIVGLATYAVFFDWVLAFCAGFLLGFILYVSDWVLNKVMGWPGNHRGKDNPLDKLPMLARLGLVAIVWAVIIFKIYTNNE